MKLSVAVVASLVVTSVLAQPIIPRSGAPRAFTRAREVIVAAAEAHGGADKLRAIATLHRSGKGKVFAQGQSLLPGVMNERELETEAWMDFGKSRLWLENRSRVGGAPTQARTVMNGDSAYTWNAATNAATRSTPGQLAGPRNNLRRDPLRLIVNAMARPEALRHVGSEEFRGKPHDVVVMAEPDGALLTLYFDAQSHLLSKVESWSDTAVLGDTLTEQVYSDYRAVNGVKVPFALAVRTAGQTTQQVTYSAIEVDAAPPANAFELPKEILEPSPLASAAMNVTTLAPGVHLIGGGTHASLAVEFRDYAVVVEAPLSSERSRAVLDKTRELIPGKPVRFVVASHHHFDHSSGLREYIAEGITIVTHPKNAAFIRELATTPRTIRPDRLGSKPVEPRVETISGKRVFTDGEQTLEIHPFETTHAEDMLIAYFPRQKILFNIDLFGPPLVGPPPAANDFIRELLRGIRSHGFVVETLAGAHGRLSTLAELEGVVAKGEQSR